MRDSRIGAIGAISLILLLGLKWSLLAQYSAAFWILMLIPAVGRATMVLAIQCFPYAREQGLGSAYRNPLSPGGWIAAFLPLLISILFVGTTKVFLSMIIAIVLGLGFAKMLTGDLGGLTGDTYGAINELAEVLFLLILLGRW